MTTENADRQLRVHTLTAYHCETADACITSSGISHFLKEALRQLPEFGERCQAGLIFREITNPMQTAALQKQFLQHLLLLRKTVQNAFGTAENLKRTAQLIKWPVPLFLCNAQRRHVFVDIVYADLALRALPIAVEDAVQACQIVQSFLSQPEVPLRSLPKITDLLEAAVFITSDFQINGNIFYELNKFGQHPFERETATLKPSEIHRGESQDRYFIQSAEQSFYTVYRRQALLHVLQHTDAVTQHAQPRSPAEVLEDSMQKLQQPKSIQLSTELPKSLMQLCQADTEIFQSFQQLINELQILPDRYASDEDAQVFKFQTASSSPEQIKAAFRQIEENLIKKAVSSRLATFDCLSKIRHAIRQCLQKHLVQETSSEAWKKTARALLPELSSLFFYKLLQSKSFYIQLFFEADRLQEHLWQHESSPRSLQLCVSNCHFSAIQHFFLGVALHFGIQLPSEQTLQTLDEDEKQTEFLLRCVFGTQFSPNCLSTTVQVSESSSVREKTDNMLQVSQAYKMSTDALHSRILSEVRTELLCVMKILRATGDTELAMEAYHRLLEGASSKSRRKF